MDERPKIDPGTGMPQHPSADQESTDEETMESDESRWDGPSDVIGTPDPGMADQPAEGGVEEAEP